MKRFLREPLVHFLLGGAALFLLYGGVAGPDVAHPDRIVVTEDRVAMLARGFERTWMRPPTEAELEGLIEDYVTEEILYREALALGLDQDDLIVRRRMRQKMEFLSDGLAGVEPAEEELRAFLEAHPERFRRPARLTFAQVFLRSDAEPGHAEARAADLLARLRDGAAPETLGDASLLPGRLRDATPREIAGSFGDGFAEALLELPEDRWSGPVASGLGLHLVRVEAHEPSRLPSLAEARPAVEREWEATQRREARARLLEALRARYEIEVERPGVADEASAPVPV